MRAHYKLNKQEEKNMISILTIPYFKNAGEIKFDYPF